MRVRELTIQYRPHPSGAISDNRSACTPATAAAILLPMLQHQAEEVFTILLLNAKCRLIAVHDISRGTIDSCHVPPERIFRAALLANASKVILAHNHPSGDPTPSQEDIILTRRLIDGGKLLGIEIMDHIVIGDGNYCSFKETGRL